MSRSFLATFRGADARSIARALVLLLTLNAIFGAFHSGAMAQATAGEMVLCSIDGAVRIGDGLPQEPSGAGEVPCCVIGWGPSPVALADEPATSVAPALVIAAVATPLSDHAARHLRPTGSASPRGPPALA